MIPRKCVSCQILKSCSLSVGTLNYQYMDRVKKLELIQRSLGLRHKIKVLESMKAPDTHEELAIMLISKWELEDELKAIDDILGTTRAENVKVKQKLIHEGILTVPKAKKKSK